MSVVLDENLLLCLLALMDHNLHFNIIKSAKRQNKLNKSNDLYAYLRRISEEVNRFRAYKGVLLFSRFLVKAKSNMFSCH